MTEVEKAKALWRLCGNVAIPLSGSDRAQIANSFKAMIEKAEQAEGFEAFKREVSDAVEDYCGYVPPDSPSHPITRFIIAKPDPLVEALNDMKDGRAGPTTESYAACLRAAIEKRGGKIVWGEG